MTTKNNSQPFEEDFIFLKLIQFILLSLLISCTTFKIDKIDKINVSDPTLFKYQNSSKLGSAIKDSLAIEEVLDNDVRQNSNYKPPYKRK